MISTFSCKTFFQSDLLFPKNLKIIVRQINEKTLILYNPLTA